MTKWCHRCLPFSCTMEDNKVSMLPYLAPPRKKSAFTRKELNYLNKKGLRFLRLLKCHLNCFVHSLVIQILQCHQKLQKVKAQFKLFASQSTKSTITIWKDKTGHTHIILQMTSIHYINNTHRDLYWSSITCRS